MLDVSKLIIYLKEKNPRVYNEMMKSNQILLVPK